eukprot:194631_1
MGSYLSWNTNQTLKTKDINTSSAKIKMELILNYWLALHLHMKSVPIDVINIIINKYLYIPLFDKHVSFGIKNTNKRQNDYDYMFKVVLIGNKGVGKKSLLLRYADDEFTDWSYTIDIDLKIRTIEVDNKIIKLQIWKPQQNTSNYYVGAHAILLCYDITNYESMQDILYWNDEYEKNGRDNYGTQKIIVGTKCDLDYKKECNQNNVLKIANQCRIEHMIETSSKKAINIDKLFMDLIRRLIDCMQNGIKYPWIPVSNQKKQIGIRKK